MRVRVLGLEAPLEKDMAAHSSVLAWRIPWTEEPDGLWAIGLQSRTQLKRFSTAHTPATTGSAPTLPSSQSVQSSSTDSVRPPGL